MLSIFPSGLLIKIPEHTVCFMLLPISAKIQSLKPFKRASMHNLIKLLVCKEDESYTHYW